MLASVLLNKLPPELRLMISRKPVSGGPDLDQLLKMVEEKLTAREHASLHRVTSTSHHRQEKARPTATTLFSGAKPPQMATPICCYCQQSHPSASCSVIKLIDAQKQILRSSGCCFNCLGRGHLSRNCRSSGRCAKCRGRHHSSVCLGGSHDSL